MLGIRLAVPSLILSDSAVAISCEPVSRSPISSSRMLEGNPTVLGVVNVPSSNWALWGKSNISLVVGPIDLIAYWTLGPLQTRRWLLGVFLH